TELWCSTEKRIIMDADILVVDRPVGLLEWIQHGNRPFMLGQPPVASPAEASAKGQRLWYIQVAFKDQVRALSESLQVSNRFLDGCTGGFYGCMDDLTLEKIEPTLRKCIDLGVPMEQWGSEQCTVIFLLSIAGAERLDSNRCLNFDPDCLDKAANAEILHFYGTYRFYKSVYPRLASRVVAELGRACAAAV